MSLNNKLPGRTAGAYIRTFVRMINSVCFGGDIQARQLEHSIGGLQGQGYCVERLSLLNGGRDFFHTDA